VTATAATRRLAIAVLILAAIAAFFFFDLGRYLSLELLKSERDTLADYRTAHPLLLGTIYFATYVAVAALSLPGAAFMTLAGGALFGVLMGTALVSFASAAGATLAFLVARMIIGDWVQQRFGARLAAINAGIDRDGAFYLFALRLVPLFPFFVVNLVMGLTRLPARTFYWVSQIGMLPGTLVYVYAGTQLGEFRISLGLVLAFVLLGVFPLFARKAIAVLKARRLYAHWPRPARFDYNLVVIGAGSAGLVSAYIGAATRAKVALIEEHQMGGDCLNTGCVPSKALLRSAKLAAQFANAREFGIVSAQATVDFAAVMERVARVIKTIEPHDSVARYTALGVNCLRGTARITSPWTVTVRDGNTETALTTRSIVIAAGSRPLVPPIPGLDQVGYYTSDSVWNLRELPRRLVVLGGGPIGCELAQAFARLGARVTQVEMLPRILVREDPDVSAQVQAQFEREGIRVLVDHSARQFLHAGEEKILVASHQGHDVRLAFDAVLVAVGRVANTSGYGLEELGIGTTRARTVATDGALQTIYPNIFACGDVAGPYQFTHTAAHQAWYAAVNALFGNLRRFNADYRVIPWATFTDPEVARVGLNEIEAKEKNIAATVTVYGIDDLDRAIADGNARGMVKVLTAPGSDRILGATIVGEHAGDLLAEFVLAMKHGMGLNKILGTIHTYPTLAEANKYVAGNWKRGTVTRGQWAILDAYQGWRRGANGLGAVIAQLSALVRDQRPAYASDAAEKVDRRAAAGASH